MPCRVCSMSLEAEHAGGGIAPYGCLEARDGSERGTELIATQACLAVAGERDASPGHGGGIANEEREHHGARPLTGVR